MITNNIDYTNYNTTCIHVESYKKKYSPGKYANKNNKKEEIFYWINLYNFTHFLTIRFPKHHESENLSQAETQLRKYMACFERELFGRNWNHKHLFFMAFAERGVGINWHFHILFNFEGLSEEKITKALVAVEEKMELSSYHIRLDVIDHLPKKVFSYSTKEIKFDMNNKGDTSTIIPSTALFDLPYAKTYHYLNNTPTIKPIENIEKKNDNKQTNGKVNIIQKLKTRIYTIHNELKYSMTHPSDYIVNLLLHYINKHPVVPNYLYHICRYLYVRSNDKYD